MIPQKAGRIVVKLKDHYILTIGNRTTGSELNAVFQNFRTLLTLTGVVILSAAYAAAGQCEAKGGSEYALFNPEKGVWYANSADGCAFAAVKWGVGTDKIVPADFDGDRTLDAAVWRAKSGTWFVRRSSDAKAVITKFGESGDVPVAADYDGDGKADLAVWRPATGEWLIGTKKITFGVAGDVPVPADYDGDGKADLAVFRGAENRWMIMQSSDGRLRTEVLGQSGVDSLVPADYTGDGKADIAVYSNGKWQVLSSETGEVEPFVMGFTDDVAAPADYDGDGVVDFAVFRKGRWYVYESGSPKFRSFNFGNENDIPLATAAITKKSFSP